MDTLIPRIRSRKSVIDFRSTDVVPHIAERKTHSGSRNFRSTPQKDFRYNICHEPTLAIHCPPPSARERSRGTNKADGPDPTFGHVRT